MRVLVVSSLYPSAVSRTWGSFVHNQVRFAGRRCQVQVVAPAPYFPLPGCGRWSAYRKVPHCEVWEGVEVFRPRYVTWPRRLFFAGVWRSFLRALERAEIGEADLVHAHCAYPDGLAAVEYGRRRGLPVVLTVHGHDIKDIAVARPAWRDLVVRALRGAALVIAVSRDLKERVQALGIAGEKVLQVPNGVDCRLFLADLERRSGEEGWRLLYVGRFDEAKGLGVLLEALGRLRRRRQDFRLTLVGGNPATGAAGPFRRRAEELGLEECVDFVGEVAWEEVPAHMGRADLFLLPSFSEGLPLVLVEAMACGLPIVATDCGGPAELVDAQSGRLVAVGDVEGLERAIDEVLDSYASFDRRAIRRRAEEGYDYERLAGRLCELYEGLVGRPAASTVAD